MVHPNGMARRLEGNTGKYTGGEAQHADAEVEGGVDTRTCLRGFQYGTRFKEFTRPFRKSELIFN
jgi:hypothetical protein